MADGNIYGLPSGEQMGTAGIGLEDDYSMEDRAIERLEDLYYNWMEPYVKSTTTYPIDCVFTAEELETIGRYKPDFESQVAEYEANWIKNGPPTDEEWSAYIQMLRDSCGMDKLLEVYQNAVDRYNGK